MSWDKETSSAGQAEGTNHYELLEPLAVGTLSVVYRGRLHSARGGEELVAVKRLSSEVSGCEEVLRALTRQLRLAERLMHPGIVQNLEVGWLGEELFVASELVEGVDLDRLLQRPGERRMTLPSSQAAFIVLQLVNALSYAHNDAEPGRGVAGVVHGDLSPANVLITAQDQVKLTNFCTNQITSLLSEQTRRRRLVVKLASMAPELLAGQPASPASDVYGLALLFYELLTGVNPQRGRSFHETVERSRRGVPSSLLARLPVPEALRQVLTRALEPEPASRYPNAAVLSAELRPLLLEWVAERPGEGLGALVEHARTIGEDLPPAEDGLQPARPLQLPRSSRRSAAPSLASSPPLAAGAGLPGAGDGRIGRYDLVRQLGAGGIGITYLATTRGAAGFEKKVVIKKLQPRFSRDPSLTRTLIVEAKTVVRLVHPNVVAVHDLGLDGEDYFIVMEYVRGRDLAELLSLDGGLAPDVLIYIVLEVLEALEYAHSSTDEDGTALEVIHRDVSPENILVSLDGAVKLTDFGIAKIRSQLGQTLPGTVKGKLGYMSPEQAAGRPLDHRTDLYQVGILLFEGLTGQRLFAGESQLQLLQLASRGDVPSIAERRPELDPELAQLVDRALQRNPDDRFQTAREFHDALLSLVSGVSLQDLRRATARLLRAVESDDRETARRASRTSMVNLTLPGPAPVYVLAQDRVVAAALEQAVDELSRPDQGFELRWLSDTDETEAAEAELHRLDVCPAAVVFGGLSVALEEPLLVALRDRPTSKVLIVDEPHGEVLSLAANLCGLDAVLQPPVDPDDLLRLLEVAGDEGRLRSRVAELKAELERSRLADKSLRAEMSALAQANVRAAELLAKVQEKDELLGRLGAALLASGTFDGSLEDLGFDDLAELLRLARLSVVITLRAAHLDATVLLRDGRVLEARTSTLSGEGAVNEVRSWRRGTFSVRRDRERRFSGMAKTLADVLGDGGDERELEG